jgi:hypothetical protein
MCSQNVTNMPCFQNFVNPAASFGGQQFASHLQCSNITVRFITMEFVLDLSSPLNIALLQLLQLKNGIQATIVLTEVKALKGFELEATVLMHNDFWKYQFVMCCTLYAPMHILQLADQKTPAMDKLYYYVLQADRMLPKWLKNAEEHRKHLMSSNVWRAIKSAGLGYAS